MKKKIVKFLLLNFFLFAIAVGIYAVGYEYDKANKLYPEMYDFASDASIMTYGKRWERIAIAVISFGVLFDVVAIMIWYRGKQSEVKNNLDLLKEE